MRFHRIEATQFRNLSQLSMCPHARFNVLYGDNAQGKTNLLEAIYLLATQEPFRAQKNSELVALGKEDASIAADVSTEDGSCRVHVKLTHHSKKVFIDGKHRREGISAIIGSSAVLFTPEELGAPRGSPGERRSLLDRAITTLWPDYRKITTNYQRVLSSRNRILKEHHPQMAALLDTYDVQLSNIGTKIISTRIRFLNTISVPFAERFSQIAQSGVVALLRYEAEGFSDDVLCDAQQTRALFQQKLGEQRSVDLHRKLTTEGPHTHDLGFYLDGNSAKRYASQGQLRALVLAFKVAQMVASYERFNRYPTLLLDDVSSELDPQRNRYFFELLHTIDCQLFLTTTRPDLIEVKQDRADFRVEGGNVLST